MSPLKLVLIAFCALAVSLVPAYAVELEMKIVDKDCWIEIFDDDDYDADDPHIKIYGPKEIATFKGFMGKDWDDDIESLIVGSNATVLAYADKDYQGTEISFTAGQRVKDLADVKMKNEIESMKIRCGKQ